MDFNDFDFDIDKNRQNSRQLKTQANLICLGDLLQEPDQVEDWLIHNLLLRGGLSLLSGKPKAGKSTLARYLAYCVAKGEPFLGFDTKQGSVLYFALEDHRSQVKKAFRAMRAAGDEPISLHIGPIIGSSLDFLKDAVAKVAPDIVIIDPIFRLLRVRDTNDYASMSEAMEPLLHLARSTNTHLLGVHHSNKSNREGQDSVLGSVAVVGAMDAVLMLNRTDRGRTLSTVMRYGDELPVTFLDFDPATQSFSFGDIKSEADVERVAVDILEIMMGQGTSLMEPEIEERVSASTALKRQAIRHLVNQGRLVRSGSGSRGDAYRYHVQQFPIGTT